MTELFDQDKLEIVNTIVKERYDLNYDQWFSQFGRKIAIMWFGLAFILATEHFKIFNSTIRTVIGIIFVGIGFWWVITGYWLIRLKNENNNAYDNYSEKAIAILRKLRLYDLLYTVSLMQPVPSDMQRTKRDLYNLLIFDFAIGKKDEVNAIVRKYKYLLALADEVANNYSDKAWTKYMESVKNMRDELLDVGDSEINAICAKLDAPCNCGNAVRYLNLRC